MSHSVSEAAARAVKKSEKRIQETRTPEQRLADIRKNIAAKLFVTPDDQRLLVSMYDDLKSVVNTQASAIQELTAAVLEATKQITILQAQNEQLRVVYAQENSIVTVAVEQTAVDCGTGPDGIGTADMP